MTITAKIIADSISEAGKRITTFQLKYWRAIHSEMMTHRAFSRNASSSRAIPVAKMIEQVRTNPAMPIHWGKNQAGMQAKEELNEYERFRTRQMWEEAAYTAARLAEGMAAFGAHKQIANRILEPFQYIHVIVTATEWDNFFELRCHEDAQPEIHELAVQMRAARAASVPDTLLEGEWHLPYVEEHELSDALGHYCNAEEGWDLMRRVSAARCCRVSYLKHDGMPATIEEELALCDRLIGSRPLHASPFEHQATPDTYHKEGKFGGSDYWEKSYLHGNFVGWVQHRKLLEGTY